MKTIVLVKSIKNKSLIEVSAIKKEGCSHGLFKAKETSFFAKNINNLKIEKNNLVEINSSSKLTVFSIFTIFILPLIVMALGALLGTKIADSQLVQSVFAIIAFLAGGALSIFLMKLIEKKSKPIVEKVLNKQEIANFYEDCSKVCEGCSRSADSG